jgi:transposase
MIEVFNQGPASLISALYDQLGIGRTVDEMVRWDPAQCRLSPGTRIKALVINIFGHRKPLYRLDEFYEHMDIENLFGKGIRLEDLTDYNMARALDKLGQRGPWEVFSTICLQAIYQEQIDLKYLHSDTTSISLYGTYEDQDGNEFIITQGHSKDKRPDLKQFLYGLSVTPDKVPVCADVQSGNTSDKTWNFDFIEKLAESLEPEVLQRVIYIADSALITEHNLKLMDKHHLQFISRLPGNFNLEKELKKKAWEKEEAFEELGRFSAKKDAASYRVQEFKDELYGKGYRFLVVHSTKLDGRKTKSLQKELSRREKELQKQISQLEKQVFACEPDASSALTEFQRQHKDDYFPLTGQVLCQEKRRPGRPGKNSPVEEVYRLKLQYTTDDDAVQKAKERLSCFVLIANLKEKYTPYQILKEYKAQNNVETSFKFLKDPLFVGPIYLKKPKRVEALAYVLLIALLLFGILERRVREAMKTESEPLIIPGKVKTFTPTGKKILETLETVLVMTTDNPYRRAFSSKYKVPRVLKLAGFEPDIYLDVRDGL